MSSIAAQVHTTVVHVHTCSQACAQLEKSMCRACARHSSAPMGTVTLRNAVMELTGPGHGIPTPNLTKPIGVPRYSVLHGSPCKKKRTCRKHCLFKVTFAQRRGGKRRSNVITGAGRCLEIYLWRDLFIQHAGAFTYESFGHQY